MLTILPVPILADNYVWVAHRDGYAIVVDPGEAAPVLAMLAAEGLTLSAILITHHHADHIAGVAKLLAAQPCPVFGPASIACVSQSFGEGDRVSIPQLEVTFDVLAVPGHTLDHLAYWGRNILFCGDTLFACGCGRLFEGSPAQMHASLTRLAALPSDTKIYCTHEYTLANQRFAKVVEPANVALATRCANDEATRLAGKPTLPSNLSLERSTNPFLRCHEPAVIAAAIANGATGDTPVEVFAALRQWKDHFRG